MASNTLNILITATSKGLQDAAKKAGSELKSVFSKGQLAVKAFNETVGNGHKAVSALSGSLKGLLAGVGISRIVSGLFDAGTESQRLGRAFDAIKGSGKEAADELEFVRSTADRLGQEFYGTADAYKGILAASKDTALEGEQTRKIFNSIVEASSALGLSSDQTSGSLMALSQMISKGNVQAEELRGQLGERLPGAFQLAAQAMGVSTEQLNKMLDNGEVLATDLLPKLADLLHEKYGKAALEASQDATQGLNRFQTAWKDLKAEVAKSGFLEAATSTLNRLTQLFKDQEFVGDIKRFAGMLSTAVEWIVKLVVEWRGALATLALTAGAISVVTALGSAISKLILIVKGLKAAFVVMTGSGVLTWFAELKTAIVAVATAAGLAGTAMKAGLAAGAAYGAVQIGLAVKALYDWAKAANTARKATEDMLASADETMKKLEDFKDVKLPDDITGMAQADLQDFAQQLRNAQGYWTSLKFKLEEKAKETTWLGTSTEEAKAAQAELKNVDARIREIRDDMKRAGEAASTSSEGFEKPAQAVIATEKQLDKFEKEAKKAYESARKEAEKYAQEVIAWEEKIKYARLSTEDKIRELGRKGLSEELAWNDTRLQADQKLYAAKEALKNGDFELAEKLAKDAEGLYADLAEEVKGADKGDAVVKGLDETKQVAITGVTEVGKFIETLYTQQKDNAAASRDKWTETANAINEKLNEIATQREANVKIELSGLESARSAIAELVRPATKHITVVQHTVQASQAGGAIGLTRGAKLPGYGGGDRIRALLEAGEFVIRKEAVKKYGSALFAALNSMRLDLPGIVKARVGGMISKISFPELSTPTLAFAAGGGVPAPRASDSMTIRFQAGDVEMPITAQGSPGVTRQMVKQFERELIKMGMARK
jgi:tape measure domain-containing protein